MSKKEIQDRHLKRRLANNTNNADIRDRKGRFIKGNSGNPKGCPKGLKEKYNKIREQIADSVLDTNAIEKLKNSIKSGKPISNKDLHFSIEKALSILPKEQIIEGIDTKQIQVLINKEDTSKVVRDRVSQAIKEAK